MEVTAALITREDRWPAVALDLDQFAHSRVLTHSPDVLHRFRVAAVAPTDHVYVQDDDIRVDVAELFTHYDQQSLTHVMSYQMRRFYMNTGVTLIGYGAFFPRAWAEAFMDRVPYWESIFGREIVAMECDRLFTWDVWPAHRAIDMAHVQFVHAEKMCERPGHYETRRMIFDTLRKLPHPSGRVVR